MRKSLKLPAVALLLSAGASIFPGAVQASVIMTPSPGFSIGFNGNDGDNFTPASPAPVPANLASTGNGATPFASSFLDFGVHYTPNINDGLYGNANSWIALDGDANPFAGVNLGGTYLLSSFAFGRDNGNNVEVGCAGGQCQDRNLGIYTIQTTMVLNPGVGTGETGDSATGWETIATVNYVSSEDAIVGGLFTGYFRHEFTIAEGGLAIPATGFRIKVPRAGAGNDGNAIDEIELFGTAVPEPSTGVTVLAVLGAMVFRRRRK